MYEVQTVKVMRPWEKIFFFLLILVTLISIVNYGVWWFSPDHLSSNWDEPLLNLAYFAILSWVVWRGFISHIFLWWVVWNMKRPVHADPEPGLRVAMITCFVPGKEPLDMLERTLIAMKKVRYPHHTWVLDEGDDPKVKALCVRLGVFHFSRKGNPKYNQPKGRFKAKTKAGNHNAWHDSFGRAYDLVAQMDVDYIPHIDYLARKNIGLLS